LNRWMWAGDPYTAFIREDLNNSYTAADNFGIDIAGYGCRQIYTQFFESRHHPLDRRLLCLDMFRFFVRDENSANIKTIAMAVGPKADSCKALAAPKEPRYPILSKSVKHPEISRRQIHEPVFKTEGITLAAYEVAPTAYHGTCATTSGSVFRHILSTSQLIVVFTGLLTHWEIWKIAANSARNGGGCVAETGFGEARPGVQPPSKAAEAATRPQTKVMSAADDGLDRNHLD
ncbi:peptidase s41 family protein, partial [Colletotrichum incanum]